MWTLTQLLFIFGTTIFLLQGWSFAQYIAVDIQPREKIVIEGDSFEFICRAGIPIKFCFITLPIGQGLDLQPNVQSPESPNSEIEYLGDGFEAGQCGMKLQKTDLKYNGIFKCLMGLAESSSYDAQGVMKLTVLKRCRADSVPRELKCEEDLTGKPGDKKECTCKSSCRDIILTCTEDNGQWTYHNQTCREKCRADSVPRELKCEEGLTGNPGDKKKCTCKSSCRDVILNCSEDNGKWTYHNQTCRVPEDDEEQIFSTGESKVILSYYKDRYNFKCDPGWYLQGSTWANCRDGVLKYERDFGNQPECIALEDNTHAMKSLEITLICLVIILISVTSVTLGGIIYFKRNYIQRDFERREIQYTPQNPALIPNPDYNLQDVSEANTYEYPQQNVVYDVLNHFYLPRVLNQHGHYAEITPPAFVQQGPDE